MLLSWRPPFPLLFLHSLNVLLLGLNHSLLLGELYLKLLLENAALLSREVFVRVPTLVVPSLLRDLVLVAPPIRT